MSVAATAKDRVFFDPHMSGPVIGSVIFHFVVILLLLVGLPHITEEMPMAEAPLSVELVSEMDAKEMIKQSDKKVMERPPMQKEEPPKVPPKIPEVVKKEPPKPVAPSPPDEADDLAPPKKIEKPVPPEKKVVKPAAKKPPPKVPEKEKVVDQEDQAEQFKSVLKNLLPDEEVQDKVEKTPNSQGSSAFAPKMSMGELESLSAQLSQCWKLMSGARYAENLVVDIKLFVNPDRTVRDAQIVDVMRYNADSYYRAAADSALRAVHNPYCNPLDLPPQKYDLWKVMTVSFDPRKML